MYITSLSARALHHFLQDPRIVSSLTPSQPVYKKLSATGCHAVRLGTTGSYARCPLELDRDLLEYSRVV